MVTFLETRCAVVLFYLNASLVKSVVHFNFYSKNINFSQYNTLNAIKMFSFCSYKKMKKTLFVMHSTHAIVHNRELAFRDWLDETLGNIIDRILFLRRSNFKALLLVKS